MAFYNNWGDLVGDVKSIAQGRNPMNNAPPKSIPTGSLPGSNLPMHKMGTGQTVSEVSPPNDPGSDGPLEPGQDPQSWYAKLGDEAKGAIGKLFGDGKGGIDWGKLAGAATAAYGLYGQHQQTNTQNAYVDKVNGARDAAIKLATARVQGSSALGQQARDKMSSLMQSPTPYSDFMAKEAPKLAQPNSTAPVAPASAFGSQFQGPASQLPTPFGSQFKGPASQIGAPAKPCPNGQMVC